MNSVDDLLEVLTLKNEKDYYLGVSETVGSKSVFGGQVLAQSLNAAYQSINDRKLHSLHSYFLERGDLNLPIRYYVDQIRDGGSFSTRRVTAKQNDNTIFILAASFHKDEKGYEHFIKYEKEVKPPEDLLSWTQLYKKYSILMPKKLKNFLKIERPIEFKPTKTPKLIYNKGLPPKYDIWFKLKGEIPDLSIMIKQQILTYISDYNLLRAALNPHLHKTKFANTMTASLDHAMWFYRDFNLDDWLLYSIESPSASNARGMTRGHIYTRKGILIASVAQEGLIRPIDKK
ncbi:MAG: acyl-CoA thioesterase II [Flavobacteriales bacterium]|nr:MAG: acyl-CoA thioesterase II [Flavobacteriales bacterium]